MTTKAASEVDFASRPAVLFTASQVAAYERMLQIVAYFFTRSSTVPLKTFRGFLLEGPPASGKTEVAFQVAKAAKLRLGKRVPPLEVELSFLDSSIIAAPHWGEAEGQLAKSFDTHSLGEARRIVLIDDIECLMLTRGSEISKEWHYSINSVIFHLLDELEPTQQLVVATTNRPDLVDDALRSRLYSIQVDRPNKDELLQITRQMAQTLGLGDAAERVADAVSKKLSDAKEPTLRTVQHLLIDECIDSGFWRSQV